VIAVDGRGNISMSFNTAGMFRGAADSEGRFEVAIWD
jgi:isoaspartyl peptidase/L-asparaginase-like protein (Ntn-hydrolase superfamily)